MPFFSETSGTAFPLQLSWPQGIRRRLSEVKELGGWVDETSCVSLMSEEYRKNM